VTAVGSAEGSAESFDERSHLDCMVLDLGLPGHERFSDTSNKSKQESLAGATYPGDRLHRAHLLAEDEAKLRKIRGINNPEGRYARRNAADEKTGFGFLHSASKAQFCFFYLGPPERKRRVPPPAHGREAAFQGTREVLGRRRRRTQHLRSHEPWLERFRMHGRVRGRKNGRDGHSRSCEKTRCFR